MVWMISLLSEDFVRIQLRGFLLGGGGRIDAAAIVQAVGLTFAWDTNTNWGCRGSTQRS